MERKVEKGILYWITGEKGTGKTTIGTTLYYTLRKDNQNLVLLDENSFNQFWRDSLEELMERLPETFIENLPEGEKNLSEPFIEELPRSVWWALYRANIWKSLTDQGITVIACSTGKHGEAWYDSVRKWNRKYIEKYMEVYLTADAKAESAAFEYADLVLENGGGTDVSEYVKKIMEYLLEHPLKQEDSFCRDAAYWNQYYEKNSKEIQGHSNFAETILPYLKEGKALVDLGCGNGRDSVYFIEHKLEVTGIDASEEAIRRLNGLGLKNGNFICEDFVSSKALYQVQYDYVYSRWTMHAISKRQEDELLNRVSKVLKAGGYFFIEARSIRDSLWGKGKCVGKNAFIYNGHYRRFMEKEIFLENLKNHGLTVVSVEEGQNFSKTEESNPVLVRIVASK